MRPGSQIVGALLLAATTYVAVLRIAAAKNEAAVGGLVFRLDEEHPAELEAFRVLRGRLAGIGEQGLADRLERLRERGEIWVAASMGPSRWAVFVANLSLVRRIYIRRVALLDPVAHLYPTPPLDIPPELQDTFALVSLAGALRHEVAHRDGIEEEASAYDVERQWYEGLRASPFLVGLTGDKKRAWEWALDSAVLSAEKARETAIARGPIPRR